jgi:hypothetical protein
MRSSQAQPDPSLPRRGSLSQSSVSRPIIPMPLPAVFYHRPATAVAQGCEKVAFARAAELLDHPHWTPRRDGRNLALTGSAWRDKKRDYDGVGRSEACRYRRHRRPSSDRPSINMNRPWFSGNETIAAQLQPIAMASRWMSPRAIANSGFDFARSPTITQTKLSGAPPLCRLDKSVTESARTFPDEPEVVVW